MDKTQRTAWVLKKIERYDEFPHVSLYATRGKAVAFMEEDIRDTVRRETEHETSDDLVREDELTARFRNVVEWKIEEMRVL